MIVDDLDIVRTPILPSKADPPPVIDANAMLTLPVSGELLEAIAGGDAKVLQSFSSVEHGELALRDLLYVRGELPRPLPIEDLFRLSASEGPDHPKV